MARRHGARLIAVGIVVVSVAIGAGAPVAAGDGAGSTPNEAPLADAGLDQTVDRNATVYLDATGSIDPDGEIVSYEWAIESPHGVEFEPNCGDCGRTEFLVTTAGTYNATVTVTDDDGASRSDTLRVTVRAVDPPTVRLVGLSELRVNTTGWFAAVATAGDVPLARLTWIANGTDLEREFLSGRTKNDTLTPAFGRPGKRTLRVRVVDRAGRAGEASMNVTVRPGIGVVATGSATAKNTSRCVPATGSRDPSGCQDEFAFDNSDGTIVLDDGNNDGVYTFRGYTIETVSVDGRLTDVIRVDQAAVRSAITERFTGGGSGTDDDRSEEELKEGEGGIEYQR